MRRFVIAAFLILVASPLFAHVTVRPRESRAGQVENYTVRVPTEGSVATTSVELEVPDGVEILAVPSGPGFEVQTRRDSGRIVSITWIRRIEPKASSEFGFNARNPQAGPLVWKAHQRFADQSEAHWVGVVGDPRPASVTTLAR